MVKNRIVTQITQKTGMAKSKNADNALADLRAKYYIFAKNLKFLITSLTTNHACMVGYSKARLEVAKAINSLTVDTPLFSCAGDIPAAAAVGTVDGGAPPGENNNNSASNTTHLVIVTNSNTTTNSSNDSYAAIHLALHRKNKLYHDKYTEHILTYATEWERILTTRINGHLKQSETLRVDLDHYAKKVEDLHKTINKTMTKGKPVSDDNVDKLKRNEAKLIQARAEYDRFVNDLCGYMEEVMIRGWKDLHPLLVKMAQFDTTLCNEESSLLTRSMTSVTDRLKNMKNDHPGLTPLGRLKELETASLESIARSNPDYGVIIHGGGEAATFAPLGGSSTTTIGGGGLFSTLMTSSSDELPLNSNQSSDAGGGGGGGGLYGQTASAPSSGNYDWTRGSGGGGGGGNFIAPAPSSGSDYDWATGGGGMGGGGGGRRGVSSIAPSEMVDRRRTGMYSNNPTSPQMSSMLMAMQHAPPPPTLGDIYDLNKGGTSTNAPPAQQQQYYGARPLMPPAPPPSMPPPPPPTPTNNNMMTSNFSQMSMYGGASQQGGGGGISTNPFGDDSSQVSYSAPPQQGYGAPQQQQQGYNAPPPSYGVPQQGHGAPKQQASYGQQQQQASYGQQQQAPYGAQY